MTNQPIAPNHLRPCDHCELPAVFRVALAASYADDLMEELHYCIERFQEVVAVEPARILGVVNVSASPRTFVG